MRVQVSVLRNLAERETLATLLHVYQTIWFDVLCFALVPVFLVAFAIRVRHHSAAAWKRAEDLADGRIQIARELYDSLLQGLQGVLLSFHAAAQGVPDEHESRGALERALASADRIILESRERVNRLSLEHLSSLDLEPTIQAAAEELSGLSQSQFTLERIGTIRPLKVLIVDEIFFIAREAIANSCRHAGASQISLTLDYGKDVFTLTCSDNGRGFDIVELTESATRGHWGLRCIARRATRIGATFDCHSAPGEGTQIRVIVPAGRAYAQAFSLGALFIHRTPD
jgi:signal transduction histidine kinase